MYAFSLVLSIVDSVHFILLVNCVSTYRGRKHCLETLKCGIVLCVDIADASINHFLEDWLLLKFFFILDKSGSSEEIYVLNRRFSSQLLYGVKAAFYDLRTKRETDKTNTVRIELDIMGQEMS